MMVHTTNLSSSYLSNLDPNFVGPGLGGRAWRPRRCLIPRHAINYWIHKTNLICRNNSCSWRFRRCWSCNYRISRSGAIRCDADGSRREGIFIGLGSHWCLIPRHSINFQFHKTKLICRNISCSWRFRRCWSCNYRIIRGRAISSSSSSIPMVLLLESSNNKICVGYVEKQKKAKIYLHKPSCKKVPTVW